MQEVGADCRETSDVRPRETDASDSDTQPAWLHLDRLCLAAIHIDVSDSPNLAGQRIEHLWQDPRAPIEEVLCKRQNLFRTEPV